MKARREFWRTSESDQLPAVGRRRMAVDPKAEAVLALHRFGFGPRVGAVAAIAGDPRGALLTEFNRPGAGRIHDNDLLGAGPAGRATFAFQQERREARRAELE